MIKLERGVMHFPIDMIPISRYRKICSLVNIANVVSNIRFEGNIELE